MGVCLCGFCNVWVCVCVGFVMCGCVGFVMCGCVYVFFFSFFFNNLYLHCMLHYNIVILHA